MADPYKSDVDERALAESQGHSVQPDVPHQVLRVRRSEPREQNVHRTVRSVRESQMYLVNSWRKATFIGLFGATQKLVNSGTRISRFHQRLAYQDCLRPCTLRHLHI